MMEAPSLYRADRTDAEAQPPAGPVAAGAWSRLLGLAQKGRGCCLTFHRAAGSAEWPTRPNRGFYVDLEYLERLIKHLLRSGWDIVTMDEVVRRTRARGHKRFVNFSIDDCYVDTVELIVPLFHRLQVPVTLFVTTGIPDETLKLPQAGLETVLLQRDRVVDDGVTFELGDDDARRAAYATISARWDRSDDIDAEYVQFCRRHGCDSDVLDAKHRITWPMLKALGEEKLVEFGGHTVRHRRISTLPVEAAFEELASCRTRLEAVLDRPIRHFAFPYGRSGDCGPRDFELAARAGYHSAATTSKGLVAPATDPFRLPRNTLNGAHRNLAFAYAHTTGLSGLATRILRRG